MMALPYPPTYSMEESNPTPEWAFFRSLLA